MRRLFYSLLLAVFLLPASFTLASAQSDGWYNLFCEQGNLRLCPNNQRYEDPPPQRHRKRDYQPRYEEEWKPRYVEPRRDYRSGNLGGNLRREWGNQRDYGDIRRKYRNGDVGRKIDRWRDRDFDGYRWKKPRWLDNDNWKRPRFDRGRHKPPRFDNWRGHQDGYGRRKHRGRR